MTPRRVSAALVGLLALGSCSDFNMVPPCEEIASDLPVLFIPQDLLPPGGSVDRARVLSLVSVHGANEIAAAYNSRTCLADLSLADGSASATFRFLARQSEGVQKWQDIEWQNADDPAVVRFVANLRSQYAAR